MSSLNCNIKDNKKVKFIFHNREIIIWVPMSPCLPSAILFTLKGMDTVAQIFA